MDGWNTSAGAPVTLLRLRAASRVLDVEWADGITAALPYQTLRESCLCAACRQRRRVSGAVDVSAQVIGGAVYVPAQVIGGAVEAPAQIDVTAIVPRGANAVQLLFSDGHDRGIFPFAYLRELRDALTRAPDAGIRK
jgi:DUF971 family protein